MHVAKFLLRRVLQEGWLPELKVSAPFECSKNKESHIEKKKFQNGGYPAFTMLDNPLFVLVLLEGVKEELKKEAQVVQVPVPARVYGDIHGTLSEYSVLFCISKSIFARRAIFGLAAVFSSLWIT